jgi:hypothetical protein
MFAIGTILIVRSPDTRNAFVLKSLLKAAIAAVAIGQAVPALAQAPRQLYNKTIVINWTVNVAQRGPDGQARNVNVAVNHTVYVSSAGRLFERSTRASKKGQKQSENAPGASQNSGGEATSLRFEGSKLVGNTAFAQGARRFEASFDSGFSSCTVSVLFGRDAAGLKRRGIDGVMYTIDSMKASGESCSIREGNALGS